MAEQKSITELAYVDDYEFFRVYDDSWGGFGEDATGVIKNPRLPMSPWVLIQFRTSAAKSTEEIENVLGEKKELEKYDISRHSEWTTVSFRSFNEDIDIENDLYDDISRELDIKREGSLKFDNFFENITIEDNGGMLNCSMRLFDKEFSRLESIIMRSIVSMKASDEFFSDKSEIDKYMLQFDLGSPQSIHFRVRFGYSDNVPDDPDFINDTFDYDENFKNRAKKNSSSDFAPKKMVVKSPWYYFQMIGLKFLHHHGGMVAEINGFSIGTSILDRLRLVQRFSLMRGTPKLFVNNLGREFFEASNGRIQIVDDRGEVIVDERSKNGLDLIIKEKNFKTEYGVTWRILSNEDFEAKYTGDERKEANIVEAYNYRIDVQYGSEPKQKVNSHGVAVGGFEREFMTIKNLLQQICSKVPPIFSYEDEDGLHIIEDGESVRNILFGEKDEEGVTQEDIVSVKIKGNNKKIKRSSFLSIPYTYAVKEITIGTERIIKIRFFYRKPAFKEQEYVRRYIWRNSPNNLFLNLSLAADTDFAVINQGIAMTSGMGEALVMGVSQKKETTDPSNTALSIPIEVDQGSLKKELERGLILVHKIKEEGNNSGSEAFIAASNMVLNMNKQSFKGVMEIPGDPFYYFSDNIQPYQYGIYIDVLRDRNIYWQGFDGPLEKSYLSGFYLISKITHQIDSSGYKTLLEISKWPTQSVMLKKRVEYIQQSSRRDSDNVQ